MPSEEMLRKLLDEFVEKEALINEELNVVAIEIDQLEQKLQGCKEKLGTIGADRQKVLDMKHRYASAEFSFGAAAAIPAPVVMAMPVPAPLPEPAPAAASDIQYPIIDNAQKAESSVANSAVLQTLGNEDDVAELNQLAQPAAETLVETPPAADAAAATGEDKEDKVVDLGAAPASQEDTDNDTVKSINDALRSLFR